MGGPKCQRGKQEGHAGVRRRETDSPLREWRARSPGTGVPLQAGKGEEVDSTLEPLGGMQLCPHLIVAQ